MDTVFAKKVGVTRYFMDNGDSLPVTLLYVPPSYICQIKKESTDGYSALQIGFDTQKPQRLSRAVKGHLSASKRGVCRYLKEVRVPEKEVATAELGAEIDMNVVVTSGIKVAISGISKGKGFAGVMKRHGMKGFCATHGTHEYFRHGGSIGCRKFPGRVFKNKRMPGRMGGNLVTQQGLTVVDVDQANRLIVVKGSVPGFAGSWLKVTRSAALSA